MSPPGSLTDFPPSKLFLTENISTKNGHLFGQLPEVQYLMSVSLQVCVLELSVDVSDGSIKKPHHPSTFPSKYIWSLVLV